MTDQSVYDDDGRYIGEMVELEDGSAVAVDANGVIVAAVDANMQDLDPAEFQVVNDEPDGAAQLRQEIAELRQDIQNQPPPATQYELPEARDERWAAGVDRELDNVEQMIGRQLTDAETHRILADHKADFDAGVGVDMFKSAGAAGLIDFAPGRDSLNETQRHDKRVEFMAEAVTDARREESGEEYDPREPWVEPASTDPGDVRRAAITNAAHGHETDDPGSGLGEEETY